MVIMCMMSVEVGLDVSEVGLPRACRRYPLPFPHDPLHVYTIASPQLAPKNRVAI